jgi:LmbE family N-acetylglucosaminyl deacetylase
MKKNVLVIAAHPDDEVLGAGGAIARHVEEGDVVTVLILGEGVTSRKGDENAGDKLAALSVDSKKANDLLGVSGVVYGGLPDNRFDTAALLSIAQKIEEVAKRVVPEIVYTHHHGDVNVDHRLTADAVQAAFRPMKGASVKEIYAFEIASSTEWNFRGANPFRPNVFVGLSEEQLAKKIAALEAYKDEIRDFPHPRSRTYLAAMAQIRGGQSGTERAEAFELVYTLQ